MVTLHKWRVTVALQPDCLIFLTAYLSLFFFSFLFHLPDFFLSPPFFSFSLSRFHQTQPVGLGLEELWRGSWLGRATVDCLGLEQADLTHKIFFSLCEALSWSWPNQKSFLNFPEKQTLPLKNKNGKNTAGDCVLISDWRPETVSWRVLVLFAWASQSHIWKFWFCLVESFARWRRRHHRRKRKENVKIWERKKS